MPKTECPGTLDTIAAIILAAVLLAGSACATSPVALPLRLNLLSLRVVEVESKDPICQAKLRLENQDNKSSLSTSGWAAVSHDGRAFFTHDPALPLPRIGISVPSNYFTPPARGVEFDNESLYEKTIVVRARSRKHHQESQRECKEIRQLQTNAAY